MWAEFVNPKNFQRGKCKNSGEVKCLKFIWIVNNTEKCTVVNWVQQTKTHHELPNL